jgi:hypothetical protein
MAHPTTPLDNLKEQVIRLMRYANGLTPHKLEEPLDPIVEGCIDDNVAALLELLEKMALDLIGEDEPDVVVSDWSGEPPSRIVENNPCNKLRASQRRRLQELLRREKVGA